MRDHKRLLEELRKSGLKITPQRIEIVNSLIKLGPQHPSLTQLYDDVRKKVSTVSFSTLYNTVRKLEDLGFLRLFDLLGETRIEVNLEPHVNLIDVGSGFVKDISDPELMETILKKLEIEGFEKKLILVNVIIYNSSKR